MDDLDVYEVLVREHEAMLFAFVMGLVRDPATAEDLCQEAFIQGYRQLSALKEKRLFPSWLRSIARNLAFAYLRRQGREVATDPEVLAGMEEVFAHLEVNVSGALWQERARVVGECLELLPEPLKACCKLHYFESQSTKDIAAALQTSLAAVLKRLERARLSIAKCVEKKLALEEA